MVEVCRRNEGPFGSWCRARIISVDGQRYKVQYENILDIDRKFIVEEVYSEATRPVPPSMKGLCNWVAGDTIEVYDHHSWKIGKIVKVLPSNFFIVKLLESRRERTCHQSNLRPRLSWQDGKWLRAQQAARNHYVRLDASQERVSFAAFSQESHAGLQLQDLNVEVGAGNRKNGLTKTDSYLCKPSTSHVSLKATKRKPGIQMQSAYKEDFFNMEAAPQKRRAIQKSRNHEAVGESSRPLLEKVDTFPFPRKHVGEERVCMSSFEDRLNRSIEEAESSHCSVASSSSSYMSNDILCSNQKHSTRPVVYSSFDDAMSSCECPNRRQDKSLTEEKGAAKVHKLELRAYRSAMRALYASGHITWEQETLLTNLRLSLHISNDEHLFELRCLRAAQTV